MPIVSANILFRLWDTLWTSFLGIFVYFIGFLGSIFSFIGAILPIAGLVISVLALTGRDMKQVNIKFGKWKLNPVWSFPVTILIGLILYGLGYLFMIGAAKGLGLMLPYMRF